MDIPRLEQARKRRIRRTVYGIAGVIVIVLTTLGLRHLQPAAPTVDSGTLWPDTVKRGPMVVEVRGLGILTPMEIQWIPAVTDGRVQKRLVLPGMKVKQDTVLLILTNPMLEQDAQAAEAEWKEAEADYNSLKAQLDSQLLDQRGTASTTEADCQQAKLQADRDAELAREGLGSRLTLQLSESKAGALAVKADIEKQRVEALKASIDAQLAAQKSKVDQLRAAYQLKHQQVEDLQVRAGIEGVLQLLPVEVGQQVTAGTNLARVSEPSKLKAEVKIAETQVKDVAFDQKAVIDTHNGIIPGHVIRIDPSSVAGTVTVDVALDGPLPGGARPDLSVDGTITIERLDNVLYMGRPAFGQPYSTVSIFKETSDGKEAVRVPVKLGRGSVTTIEILDGLKDGDRVILSDMSRWDNVDRIRLE